LGGCIRWRPHRRHPRHGAVRTGQFRMDVWTGWTVVPGSPAILSAPTVTVWRGNLHIFVRGSDHRTWGDAYNGSSWNGWAPVPDSETYDPPGTAVLDDVLYLFRRGTDNGILYNRYTTNWLGWRRISGGPLSLSAPAVATYNGNVHLFFRGTDGYTWGTTVRGVSQAGWGRVPDSATSAAPALAPNTHVMLVVRRPNGALAVNDYSTNWNGWTTLPDVPNASAPSANAFRVYVRGADNHIYRNRSAFEFLQ
jgi:hypothetical protein